jgi:membrane protein implicated in regulation of membrane protease activity
MYSGDDLYEDEADDDGADRIDKAVTHLFVGVLEAAAWLVGLAAVAALIGTDVESSPWFWAALIALPLIITLALLMRRTRRRERVAYDRTDRS